MELMEVGAEMIMRVAVKAVMMVVRMIVAKSMPEAATEIEA